MQSIFSNDLNTLVDAAAGVLSAESFRSPLAPDWLIVPNHDTGRWLQIELTDRLGSLANTKVTTFNEFIWWISDAHPDQQFQSDLYWAIATIWQQKYPDLTPPEYLQQVGCLFEIFQNYLAERPDWLTNLEKASSLIQQSSGWQIALWRDIEPLLPTAAPHRKLMDALKEPNSERLDSIARIILFNPDRLSMLALNALKQWSHDAPLFLCTQSPSPEPWFTQGALELPETHPILADLCREKAKVLSMLGDDEPIEGYTPTAPKNALSELKAHIFDNRKASIKLDQSVSLISATSPTQEVMELKRWLIDWLNVDPARNLKQVQIVTPNPALYGPIVQRIFHSSDPLQRLPTTADPLIIQPIEVVAINLLAEVCRSGFKGGSVNRFLSNITVRETLELSDQKLRHIQRWIVQSGARRGVSGYRHTLQAAKKRLLRGLMTDPEAAFKTDSTPTESIEQTDGLDRLMGVLSAIEHLLSAPDMMQLHVAIQRIDEAVNRLTLGHISSLNLHRLTTQFAEAHVNLNTVFQWVQLNQQAGLSRPLALNDQLSVTTPQTIRSIPNQVVAILGANHDTFPQESNEHPWDLVAKNPRPGDLIESEKERQVLADIVLNTSDQLWISWIGKHPIYQTTELPGPGVVLLIDCFRDPDNASPVVELPSGINLDGRPTRDPEATTVEHAIQTHWTVQEFLDAAAEPAVAFLKQKGARIRVPEFQELNVEPLAIDTLSAFKMRQRVAERQLTADSLVDCLMYDAELPDDIDVYEALQHYAPSVVFDALATQAQIVEPSELRLSQFIVQVDGISTITAPRIVIKSSLDGVRGLRALLEGLILYAIEPTEQIFQLVTFDHRVTPFGPIPTDEAKTLLNDWLEAICDRHAPCALIAPLALATAKMLVKDCTANPRIDWNHRALAHQPEYQRIFQNDPHISEKHSDLCHRLVQPLLHYLGKPCETL